MGRTRSTYGAVQKYISNFSGKQTVRKAKASMGDNIKVDLREMGYDTGEWIDLAEDRDQW